MRDKSSRIRTCACAQTYRPYSVLYPEQMTSRCIPDSIDAPLQVRPEGSAQALAGSADRTVPTWMATMRFAFLLALSRTARPPLSERGCMHSMNKTSVAAYRGRQIFRLRGGLCTVR